MFTAKIGTYMKYESKRDIEHKISSVKLKNVFPIFHFHQSIELNYVLSGKLSVRLAQNVQEFSEGEIAFIPSYVPHSVGAIGETWSENLIIPYRYFKTFDDNDIQLNYFKLDNVEINKKLFGIIHEIQALKNDDNPLLLQAYITVLLCTIEKEYPKQPFEGKTNNLIIEIIKYIEENFKTNLTLPSIAAHFGYNKFHFSKLFNKTFNCNLKTYINQVRINYIKSNLDSEKNITDLILEAGFANTSTYYRIINNFEA